MKLAKLVKMAGPTLAVGLAFGAVGCDSGNGDGTESGASTTSNGTTTAGSSSGGSGMGSSGGVGLTTGPIVCDRGEFAGSLKIETAADAEMIVGFTSIVGELQLDKSDLADVNFLQCLESITASVNPITEGELFIFQNDNLVSLDGLSNLTEVQGGIVITRNNALPSIDTFNTDMQFEGSLSISLNAVLTEVTGFTSLTVLEENLTVRDNPMLTSIRGLRGLRVVLQTFSVVSNENLCLTEVNIVGNGLAQPPMSASTAGNADC